ncbi:P-loop containing nucleoside triphosphate hydrolase protein [Pholiota conissans]|uniref:P-loop containing nucleoside triphosphate hydrolase protein n=1 Tax=Pholiota conissans TaxID=109636 RepID=A0A9P5YRR6_9AGAR|nr:P-loop containing nucleoside triphosphate hydrolase protein [Pholiota conissans]
MAYYGQPDLGWSNANAATDGNALTRIMGFSVFASLLQSFVGGGNGAAGGGALNGAVMNSFRLFILGTLVESGRRFFNWAIERFKLFQYSITAQFQEGDPSYEWLVLLLTEEKVWTRARQFRVNATNSTSKWTVDISNPDSKNTDAAKDKNAEYVPTYEEAQLFKYKGYWVEIRRTIGTRFNPALGNQPSVSLYVTMYTRNMSALSALVDDAKLRYVKKTTPHVVVHSIDQVRVRPSMSFGPGGVWGNSKRKQRRPLSSIILQEGVIHSLVQDAREFLQSEDWYVKAGIPHRRGYLLHGPPGTGKSSTIYAVAGELGLEIYSLSLASGFIDDTFLQRAVSAVPKNAIFLIEDIDCAFPSREDEDSDDVPLMDVPKFAPHMAMTMAGRAGGRQASPITLSGLLNVLDGVGSEEGKIFFATTNYIDRLDSALLRPGRIDKKIQYQLATQAQAAALFLRFYPESYTTLLSEKIPDETLSEKLSTSSKLAPAEKEKILASLSEQFAAHVPEHEFSTAELQGFLLSCKQQPEKAVKGIAAWVKMEKHEREEKQRREDERRSKIREKKEMREAKQLHGSLARLSNLNMGGLSGSGGIGFMIPGPDSSLGVSSPATLTPPSVEPDQKPALPQSSEAATTTVMINGGKRVVNGIAKHSPELEVATEHVAAIIQSVA